MKTINTRQKRILNLVEKEKSINFSLLRKKITGVSEITLKRDLLFLQNENFLVKSGSTKDATYSLTSNYKLFKKYDRKKYYGDPKRRRFPVEFDNDVFRALENDLFTTSEIEKLEELNKKYLKNISNLEDFYKKREYERLAIEFSWRSSHIEGNTYSYLETEYLLKDKVEPEGHSEHEKNMILNHKKALDYLLKNSQKYKKLSYKKILDLHNLLMNNLDIPMGIRQRPVRIGGSSYIPLENPEKIEDAMKGMVRLINKKDLVYEKALIANTVLAYIKPFADGNKRISRVLGNAILMAYDHSPFSFRDIDELKYKEALLLFYEKNSIALLKELFIEQYRFAVENYFQA